MQVGSENDLPSATRCSYCSAASVASLGTTAIKLAEPTAEEEVV